MFLPSKIKKVRILAPNDYYDSIVTMLGELGVIQIEMLEDESKKMLLDYKSIDYDKINRYAQKIKSLENSLIKNKTNGIKIKDLNDAFHQADKIKIYEEVNELKKEEETINTKINKAESTLEILENISDFKKDLKILNGNRVESFIILKRKDNSFAKNLEKEIDCACIELEKAFIITLEKHKREVIANLAKKAGINLITIPVLQGTFSEIKSKETETIKEEKARLSKLTEKLEKISKEHYGAVETINEYLGIELKKSNIIPKIGATNYTVTIEGWVEEKKLKQINEELEEITRGKFILETIDTKSEPPTQMANPISFKLYEFFIKFYSIPKSNEIDPTIFFGIAFPIFFGLMVGDAGYGAFFLVLAIWLIHRIDHPPKKSKIPRKLAKFVKTIVSKHSLKMIMRAVIPGSIIAIALGIIFNGYFGFSLPYTPLFSVTKSVGTLLLISGWIGVFMVSFGFVLGALNKLYLRKIKQMFGRIGWLLVAWGIVIVGLAVLRKQNIGPSNISALISYALIVIGIATVLKTEGVQSLLEVPSVVSHILSYTRLIGILLASVILAEVINLIFLSTLSGSVFIIAAGVILLVFGQLFNIAIALFEGGIQGARLVYVEFFSKFYEGNGSIFKPFKIERKSTNNIYIKNKED
jgi:V/A-type H+-transporting ATPase subunit I